MDLPLCKICGNRHRLGGCPKFLDPAAERRAWLQAMTNQEKLDAPKTASTPQAVEHHQTQASEKEAPPQVKPKFDKRAYQRDLMRKRRAAAKAKPAPPLSG